MEFRQTDRAGGPGSARSVSLVLLMLAGAASCGSPVPGPAERVAMSTSAIQGGATDPTHTFAVGVVQLSQASQNMVAFCSGMLLAPNLVATARHCVAELPSATIDCATSKFGALYPVKDDFVTIDTMITMSSNFARVTKVIVPSGPNQQLVCGNDIALLILDKNIALPKYVEPVITPPMTDSQYQAVVSAIGYGIDTPTDTQGVSAGIRRSKSNVPLTCIPNDTTFADCFSDPSAKSVLTAGEFVSGDSTCEGDSGSGAFEQGNFDQGKWVAFGVLSRGGVSQDGKTCNQPIYSRFDAWGPLLVDAAQQAAAQAAAHAARYSLPVWAGGMGPLDSGAPPTAGGAPGSLQPNDDGGSHIASGTVQAASTSSGGCAVDARAGAGGGGAAERVGAFLGLGLLLFRRRRPWRN